MAQMGLARIGDTLTGTCTAHSSPRVWHGVFSVGTAGFTADGLDVVAVGDTGNTDCGHHFRVTTGSAVLTGSGKVVTRHGDSVIVIEGGTGTITSGSAYVTSE